MPHSSVLNILWVTWKTCAARPGATLYYSSYYNGRFFYVYAIDGRHVYLATVNSSSDISDFTTNYQNSCSLVADIEDAVALANQPTLVNAQLLDSTGDSIEATSNALNVSLRDSSGSNITLNTGGSLKQTIYDASGNVAVGTKGTAFPGTAGVVIVGGTDGTNTQAIATDTSGRVKIDLFDGSGGSVSSFAPGATGVRSLDIVQRTGATVDSNEKVWVYNELTTSSTSSAQVVVTYTVPANKNFYLLSYSLSHGNQGGAFPNPALLYVNTNSLGNRLDSYSQAENDGLTLFVFRGWNVVLGHGVPVATGGDTVNLAVTPLVSSSTLWCGKIVGIVR